MTTIKAILSRTPVSKAAIKAGLNNEVPIGENWGIAQFDVLYDWFTKKDRDSWTAKAVFVMQYYCEKVRHIFLKYLLIHHDNLCVISDEGLLSVMEGLLTGSREFF